MEGLEELCSVMLLQGSPAFMEAYEAESVRRFAGLSFAGRDHHVSNWARDQRLREGSVQLSRTMLRDSEWIGHSQVDVSLLVPWWCGCAYRIIGACAPILFRRIAGQLIVSTVTSTAPPDERAAHLGKQPWRPESMVVL